MPHLFRLYSGISAGKVEYFIYRTHCIYNKNKQKGKKMKKCIVISLVSDGLQTAAVIGKILSLGWKEK